MDELSVRSLVPHGDLDLLAFAGAGLSLGVEVFRRMEDGLKDADVVMMLRLQRERMFKLHMSL